MVVPDKRLRKIVYALHFDRGLDASAIQLCAMPTYGLRSVQQLLREFRTNFSWEQAARKRNKWRQRLDDNQMALPKDIIDDDPALYLDEIKKEMKRAHRIDVGKSAICRAIHAPTSHGGLGYSLLVMETRAVQQDFAERARFRRRMEMGDFDHKNCVVIDEASVGRNHARRRRGYGMRGRRVIFHDVFGKFTNGTLMAACNCDGYIVSACEWIQGTMDSDRFVQWVEHGLCPVLGNFVSGEPRSIVVLDNVAQHHDPRVVEAIEGTGAQLVYLPRYSPDFSPIELGFAHVKKALQRKGLKQITSDSLFEAALFACLLEWTPEIARACFRHCFFDVADGPEDDADEEQTSVLVVSAVVVAMLDL